MAGWQLTSVVAGGTQGRRCVTFNNEANSFRRVNGVQEEIDYIFTLGSGQLRCEHIDFALQKTARPASAPRAPSFSAPRASSFPSYFFCVLLQP